MDIRDRLNAALKTAMRERQANRLSTLRLINAAIKDRDIAARGSDDAADTTPDCEITQILAKMVKQRQESVRAYEEGGRLELADNEREEIKVIEEFLPKQLTEQQVEQAITSAIEETGATSIRDMGRVMGVLKAKYAGQMDFGRVGPEIKARLG